MFKKLIITALILIVIGALSVSVYNTTLARTNQNQEQQTIASQSNMVSSAIEQAPVVEAASTIQDAAASSPAGQNSAVASAPIVAETSQQNGAALSANTELANLPPATPGALSDAETAALQYMVEEEKLARDVYLAMFDIWGLNTFKNIASSEQMHMDAVAYLLERYGLESNATSEPGKFTNPELQKLYDTLVARGRQSLAEAIKVGGAIEEIDILDLQERLVQTDNADIQQVFNNLLRGSANHLKAFVNALQTQTGEVYQPQYMTLEAYQAILATVSGGRYGQGGGNSRSNTGAGGGYRGGRP